MKSPAVGLRVASGLFGIGALVHVLRLATHFTVAIGGQELPLWVSILAVLLAGGLSAWFWQLSQTVTR